MSSAAEASAQSALNKASSAVQLHTGTTDVLLQLGSDLMLQAITPLPGQAPKVLYVYVRIIDVSTCCVVYMYCIACSDC